MSGVSGFSFTRSSLTPLLKKYLFFNMFTRALEHKFVDVELTEALNELDTKFDQKDAHIAELEKDLAFAIDALRNLTHDVIHAHPLRKALTKACDIREQYLQKRSK